MSGNLTAGALFHAQSSELLDQALAGDAEDAGRAALVPCGEAENLADVLGLHLRERGKRERVLRRRYRLGGSDDPSREFGRQVVGQQALPLLEQHDALDQVPQLAHVSRPGVAAQHLGGWRRDLAEALLELAR